MIVLAAGGSKRLGHPKQLLPHLGRTLLRHAADVAVQAATGPVVVVLGAQADLLRGQVSRLMLEVIVNRDWRTGIATSIQAGLGSLGRDREPDAVILMTCDQPHVSAELLRRLVDRYADARPPAVACAYAGTLGTPALFDRSLFGELWLLSGDHGAKQVIERHQSGAVRVAFDNGAVDIDTAEDVARLGSERSTNGRTG